MKITLDIYTNVSKENKNIEQILVYIKQVQIFYVR